MLKKAGRTRNEVDLKLREKFEIIQSAIDKSSEINIKDICKTTNTSIITIIDGINEI